MHGSGRSESLLLALSLLLAGAAFLVGPLADDRSPGRLPPDRTAEALAWTRGILAGAFLENLGQLEDPGISFYSIQADGVVGFADDGVRLTLGQAGDDPPTRLGISFANAFASSPRGLGELPHRSNFFLGDDPSRWTRNVRSFSDILYEEVYPGVDVRFALRDGGLKYEFHVGSDVATERIEMRFQGASSIEIAPSGELIVRSGADELRDAAPVAIQGGRDLPCSYVLRASLSIGFACPGVDPSQPYTIDPLLYGTFLGGRGTEGGWSVALDDQGYIYVSGLTDSPDFPVTPETFGFGGPGSDAFIVKLDPSGREIVYASYLGGTSREVAVAVAADSEGNAYLAGLTRSSNFPTTDGVFDRSFDGVADVFVAKFNPSGDHLLFSVFIGGSDTENPGAVAVDSDGNVFVAGRTHSADFPGHSSPEPRQFFESAQIFVVKLDPTAGFLRYSFVYGGDRWDEAISIAVDPDGNAYITGQTSSANFTATPGAFDETLNGFEDAYAIKLDPSGNLVYATFLGGSDGDVALSIAVDGNGNAYVAGVTDSPDFPTTEDAIGPTLNGLSDAFVVKLDPSGSSLVYATYLGGSGRDDGEEIAIDAAGGMYVTGLTTSPDFPTTPRAFDRLFGTSEAVLDEGDGFVARLSPDGLEVLYGSYLGGSGSDLARDIAVDASGDAYVTGFTLSIDFPMTSAAFDPTFNGNPDAYVVKMRLAPGKDSPWLTPADGQGGNVPGVGPSNGTTTTPFTYSVLYTDPDNDPPLDGYPAVHVFRDGVEIPGSPFPMSAADPTDTNYADGALFQASVVLPERSPSYTYFFSAYDSEGFATANWPSPPAVGPYVTVDAGVAVGPGGIAAEIVLFAVVAAAVPAVLLVIRRRRMRGRAPPPPT